MLKLSLENLPVVLRELLQLATHYQMVLRQRKMLFEHLWRTLRMKTNLLMCILGIQAKFRYGLFYAYYLSDCEEPLIY